MTRPKPSTFRSVDGHFAERRDTASKDDDFQPRDPSKTAAVARHDPITCGYRGGRDQEVMSPNGHPFRRKTGPQRSMDACYHEVEREDGKRVQEPLDEGLPTMPLGTG